MNLKVEKDKVSFTIENVGDRPGREVAQVYILAKTNGMFRPEKELKGFASVKLKPGEKKEVEVKLNDRSFAVWSIAAEDWVIEPGEYEILVGASSRDIRLRKSLMLKMNQTKAHLMAKGMQEETIRKEWNVENPYKDAIYEPYYKADVKNIPDETFKALIGRDIPDPKWNLSRPLEMNDTIYMGRYSEKKIARMLYWAVALSQKGLLLINKKETAANAEFILNLPYRGIGRMSGILSDRHVENLLKIINSKKNK